MNRKFEFTGEEKQFNGRTLKRIRAKISFGNVTQGDIGGWIEKEKNLSEHGNAWVFGNAKVYGNAKVCDNVWVWDNALVWGNAKVYGNAKVCDNVWVWDNALVYDNALVWGNAKVCDNAEVYGNAKVCGKAKVYGKAEVYGNAEVYDNALVCGNAKVCGNAWVEKTPDIISFSNVGSRNDTLTAFKTKEGFSINIGCFLGSLEMFLEKVKETHGDNNFGKEYRLIAEVIKNRFEEE